MLDIKKSIEQGWGKGGLYDILKQLQEGMLPISGRTYYVSKYGNGTTGLSWANAFKTIAAAISASNTYIATTGTDLGRNRIYIDGGPNWEETLTVLPNKCDVIGIGATYGNPVRIQGRTNITTVAMGCHIYNIYFYNPTTNESCVTLVDNCSGIEFHNCIFRTMPGITTTIGLEIGSQMSFKVNKCQIIGNPAVTTGIQLNGPNATFGEITNNFIAAVTTGILIANGTTGDYQLLIKDNVIARCDPNQGTTQLVIGIDFQDTPGRSRAMVIHNWISAADAIHYACETPLVWLNIDNQVVEGTVANQETKYS